MYMYLIHFVLLMLLSMHYSIVVSKAGSREEMINVHLWLP